MLPKKRKETKWPKKIKKEMAGSENFSPDKRGWCCYLSSFLCFLIFFFSSDFSTFAYIFCLCVLLLLFNVLLSSAFSTFASFSYLCCLCVFFHFFFMFCCLVFHLLFVVLYLLLFEGIFLPLENWMLRFWTFENTEMIYLYFY